MTVDWGDFLVTFDFKSDVDVHTWWLGAVSYTHLTLPTIYAV